MRGGPGAPFGDQGRCGGDFRRIPSVLDALDECLRLKGGRPGGRAVARAARFKVDPRLASLLGESYRSSEHAIRELVNNAWDADAEHVWITLPGEMTTGPIVVEDDCTGMTEPEVRDEYLVVANDRRTRKGERTPGKKRRVKGRKGIGKFAGLIAADTMTLETAARGKLTRLTVRKDDLLHADADLEAIDLPVEVAACEAERHGTTITLADLNQKLAFPSADTLRRLLVLEYGRQSDFDVRVDGESVAIDDIPGSTFAEEIDIPDLGKVNIKFTVSQDKKPLKQSGIAIRVGGKLVGRPSTLGLEDDEELPSKLLKRIYGEIEADGLDPYVTCDWGAIIENSKPFKQVTAWAANEVGKAVRSTYKNEVSLQKARLQREAKRRLASLPENRRKLAEEAIDRVLRRLYLENEERINVVVSLMLDAFERDEYWIVLQKIDESTRADVAQLADVLGEFGLADLAVVGHQARHRLAFLDELDRLAANPDTIEAQMHTAIERNLWVLGTEYALVASNKSLARLLKDWADKEFQSKRAKKRPDLFLAYDMRQQYLLIEFKRPSHSINRDDEAQAIKYRDDLSQHVGGPIDIIVMGGKRSHRMSPQYGADRVTVATYTDLIAQARAQLAWLLSQLGASQRDDVAR